jgi:hypothetical protein
MFLQLAKVEGFTGVIDLNAPKMAKLYLPSSFTLVDPSLCMQELADVEWSL